MPSAKVRVRPAKSTAIQPSRLSTSFSLLKPKKANIDATQWVDEDVDVLDVSTSEKTKKLRKSFTREFKQVRAINDEQKVDAR